MTPEKVSPTAENEPSARMRTPSEIALLRADQRQALAEAQRLLRDQKTQGSGRFRAGNPGGRGAAINRMNAATPRPGGTER